MVKRFEKSDSLENKPMSENRETISSFEDKQMTPEQLDKIENRQAAAMWIGGPTAAFAQDTLLLVKALREALDVSKGRREEAFDWISAYFEAQRERDEARAEVERLREALQEIAEGECYYGDNCPSNAGTRHGTCTECKARQALKEGES